MGGCVGVGVGWESSTTFLEPSLGGCVCGGGGWDLRSVRAIPDHEMLFAMVWEFWDWGFGKSGNFCTVTGRQRVVLTKDERME